MTSNTTIPVSATAINNVITSLYPDTKSTVAPDFEEMIEKILSRKKPTFYKLTCQSCGAPVDQKIDDHIMKCPYCHSVYAIGTRMTNARY